MLGIQHILHRLAGGGEALQHFQIPNKMIIQVKMIMDDMVVEVQVQAEMTELFEIRDGRHHCHSFL
jgi:hypothetical protein